MSQFNVHKWNANRREASLNEGVTEFLGNGVIKIMDYAFFAIMADNEEAFNLLMDTLKNATNEEKAEMLTNLAKFRLKPTLSKLAQAELANIGTRNDQLNKAFRESTNEVELGRQGAVEIAREQALHDLQDAVKRAGDLKAVNSFERATLDTLLVRAIKRRASERGDI
jgi:hypothetical protein